MKEKEILPEKDVILKESLKITLKFSIKVHRILYRKKLFIMGMACKRTATASKLIKTIKYVVKKSKFSSQERKMIRKSERM